jgi:hypothetical protein
MLLPREWNPRHQGEKHEEDCCKDCRDCVFTACIERSAGPGRHCTGAHLLPTTVSRAVDLPHEVPVSSLSENRKKITTQGEKHEKNYSQDRINNATAPRFRRDYCGRGHIAGTYMLP